MLNPASLETFARRNSRRWRHALAGTMLALFGAAFTLIAWGESPPALLVAEEVRVVREYRLPEPIGAVSLEAGNDSLRLTIAGRNVPLDVAQLLRLPSTRLKEAVLGFWPDRQQMSLYLLIPCGFNAQRTGPAGSIVVSIGDDRRVKGIQSDSCTRR